MLPRPVFPSPPEPFDSANEEGCVPGVSPRPGVVLFRDFVMRELGGKDDGIVRGCSSTGRSGHKLGRAWDWHLDSKNPADRAKADELLAWLFDADAELVRRAGIVYIIWTRRIWSVGKRYWRDYDGYKDGVCASPPCRDSHDTHVHFSFGEAGAEAKTSFYDWLRAGEPKGAVPPGAGPAPIPSQVGGWSVFVLLGAVTVATVYYLSRR